MTSSDHDECKRLIGRLADQLDAARAEIERVSAERDLGDRILREAVTERARLLGVVEQLSAELDHATAHDGDHLSKASRRMVDTVMGERDALREKVRVLQAESDLRGQTVADLAHELGTVKGKVDAMRPVVEAAKEWHDDSYRDGQEVCVCSICRAVRTYRAAQGKAGA